MLNVPYGAHDRLSIVSAAAKTEDGLCSCQQNSSLSHHTQPGSLLQPKQKCGLLLGALTFRNLASYIWDGHKITLYMPHFIFIQQISVLNILNMLYNLHFFLFKMPFIS
jgi:hypothetical protein